MSAGRWQAAMTLCLVLTVATGTASLEAPWLAFAAFAPGVGGYLCAWRLLAHLTGGSDGPGPVSWLGWLRD